MAAPRTFTDAPAVRKRTPLLTGIVGPSGGGKTFSALRLATGIQRVSGGDIFGIDTEGGRMSHYAEHFKFRHVPFAAPFGPLDYLAAIRHCEKNGAGVVIVDSQSHEHEGSGGVLELHERELDRIAGDNWQKRQACTFLAWGKPKRERRELINAIIQSPCNFIFCFRAKPKIKIVKGKDPEPRGWQPIAGEEFVYELTLKCLLLPGADGVPTWHPEHADEKSMCKLPIQFKDTFKDNVQLSEDIGQRLAEWAAGSATQPAAPITFKTLDARYTACQARTEFDAIERDRLTIWEGSPAAAQKKLMGVRDATVKRLAAKPEPPAGHVVGVDDPMNDPKPTGKLFDDESGSPPGH